MSRTMINRLLRKELRPFEEFHKKTINKRHPSEKRKNPVNWPREWKITYFKEYQRLEKIILPNPTPSPKLLSKILYERKTTRNFAKTSCSIEQISNLLYFSSGLSSKNKTRFNRFYPSGGARYPIETYLVSLNSELERGVYHYNLRGHTLEFLTKNLKLLKGALQDEWMYKASFLVILTAVFGRNIMKYSERGYRYILIESGHVAQNFYLNATAEGLGISGVGGYLDEQINQLLDIDGIKESVVYVLVSGNEA